MEEFLIKLTSETIKQLQNHIPNLTPETFEEISSAVTKNLKPHLEGAVLSHYKNAIEELASIRNRRDTKYSEKSKLIKKIRKINS